MRLSIALLCVFFLLNAMAVGGTTRFGMVQFANSCRSDLSGQINEAVALLHSFEFEDAQALFQEIATRDPGCSISAWGRALANCGRLGANAPEPVLRKGWDELQPWLRVPANSRREQMYLDAVRGLYENYSHSPPKVRAQRYVRGMEAIRHEFKADVDGSLFYALGLIWTANPGSDGIAQRQRALTILRPIFKRFPDHPGAAHYIIHCTDTAELASAGLPAARKYAGIAPDSPHALHMPSHIFGRLGYWTEMIRSNEDSARVAQQWIDEGRDGLFDLQHALMYLEYGYLQLNDRASARRQVVRVGELMSRPGADNWAEIDARILFDVTTADWDDALTVEPPVSSPAKDNFDIYWIRAIAAAHKGQVAAAQMSVARLREAIDQQKENASIQNFLHIYWLQAGAALDAAANRRRDAVQKLAEAIVYERAHPFDYPTSLTPPSAEVLGMLLLDFGEPMKARAAFDQALKMAPNRWNSLEGRRRTAMHPSRRVTIVGGPSLFGTFFRS